MMCGTVNKLDAKVFEKQYCRRHNNYLRCPLLPSAQFHSPPSYPALFFVPPFALIEERNIPTSFNRPFQRNGCRGQKSILP
uniref:Uncharacterized protein n=1 Tax=Onchocerca volvulus TaxID=6282 RepID=A0A8R1TQ35_ONCVO